MKQIAVTVNGMHCGGCVARLKKALLALPGMTIMSVTVGRAELTIDESEVSTDQIMNAIRQIGFQAISID